MFQEMKAQLKEDDRQVPHPDGPYEYFPRFVRGGQYAQLCRIPRGGLADKERQVLLDGNAEAAGKVYWDLGATAHTLDHKLLAYATDDKGSTLHDPYPRSRDGPGYRKQIPETSGGLRWARRRRCYIEGRCAPSPALRLPPRYRNAGELR